MMLGKKKKDYEGLFYAKDFRINLIYKEKTKKYFH